MRDPTRESRAKGKMKEGCWGDLESNSWRDMCVGKERIVDGIVGYNRAMAGLQTLEQKAEIFVGSWDGRSF